MNYRVHKTLLCNLPLASSIHVTPRTALHFTNIYSNTSLPPLRNFFEPKLCMHFSFSQYAPNASPIFYLITVMPVSGAYPASIPFSTVGCFPGKEG
jgi:hypothetical protein